MAKATEKAASKTPDLLGDTCDLAGEVPAPTVKARTLSKSAARVARYREKHGVRAVTVHLPIGLADELEQWLAKRQGETKSTVIVRLLKTQLLRKR